MGAVPPPPAPADAARRRADGLHRWALGAVLAWGALLRIRHLDTPLRHDEATTYFVYVARPLRDGLADYALRNNHLMNTFLAHLSTSLLGDGPVALRLPALVAGILCVPAAYVVARALYGRDAGLVAAGLVAASSELIKYSTNARGYSFVVLFFLALVALGHALRRRPVRLGWTLFAVCAALGTWSVASMLYAYGTVLAWLLLSAAAGDVAVPRRRFLLQAAAATGAAALLVVVLYAPVAVWGQVSPMFHSGLVRAHDWAYLRPRHARELARLWTSWHLGLPRPLAVAFPILAGLALVRYRAVATVRVPLALAVALCPLPVAIVQRVESFARVWIFLLPLYLGLVAAGLVYLIGPLATRVRARPAIVCALALALAFGVGLDVVRLGTVYASRETGTAVDAAGITEFLKPALRPGDRLSLSIHYYPTFLYYFQRAGLPESYLGYAERETRRVYEFVRLGDLPGDPPPVRAAGRARTKARARWSDSVLLRVFGRFDPVALYERHRLDGPPG